MNIACFPVAISNNRNDQWVTSRAEGRITINVGFGFGEMGHNVDIIHENFDIKHNVYKNVSLLKNIDTNKYYDVVFVYNSQPPLPLTSYGRALLMVEPGDSLEKYITLKSQNPKIEFFTMSQKAVPHLKKFNFETIYFPCLYPIPCLPWMDKQEFLPLSFDINKDKIKVWVYSSSWVNYYLNCDRAILEILRILKNKFNLNIELILMTRLGSDSGNPTTNEYITIVKEFNPRVIDSRDMCYIDVLNILKDSDICITKGGFCYCGNCTYDIVSLGKLLFYVTEGPWWDSGINDLYLLEEYVIRNDDSNENLERKISNILSNPNISQNAIRSALSTYSYPEWEKIVKDILT